MAARYKTEYRKRGEAHDKEVQKVRAELLKASKDDLTLKANAQTNAKRYK